MSGAYVAATILRARPLLGAFVRIEARAATRAQAQAAVDAAFGAVTAIHAAMSFHESRSELSRINAAAPGEPLTVSPAVGAVLRVALAVAQASDGAFDPVVAARRAVETGALPRPVGRGPDLDAAWRDLTLSPDATALRLERPLWLDLGGVAKGWAVDVAVEALRAHGAVAGWVDAGGDLRAFGRPLAVALDARAPHAPVPRLEIADAALASSGGLEAGEGLAAQAHVDGRGGAPLGPAFAAVTAPTCALADALTKVVLARGADAASVLDRFHACAYHLAPGRDWAILGEGRP